MTRYCVQIVRTYEVLAEDAERAEELVREMEGKGALDDAPLVNVTDLDEAARVPPSTRT